MGVPLVQRCTSCLSVVTVAISSVISFGRRRFRRCVCRNMSRCLNKRTFWLTCIFLIMFGSFVALLGNIYIIGDADDYFRHVLDETDSRDLLETLRVLATTLDSANLTYFLLFGTLIGSYRHHGRIPWDDDIDIMADVTQKPQIREALLRCQPKYTLQVSPQNGTYSQHVWKFYKADGYKYPHRQHRWPFVDLTFFRSNDTHVYHDYKGLTPVFNFKKTLVFPLKVGRCHRLPWPLQCPVTACVIASVGFACYVMFISTSHALRFLSQYMLHL